MELTINGCRIRLSLTILENDTWRPVRDNDPVQLALSEKSDWIAYSLELNSVRETQVRLQMAPEGEDPCFHVITCCILGDSNAALVHKGEFPVLTEDTQGDVFRSPFWEFRAMLPWFTRASFRY